MLDPTVSLVRAASRDGRGKLGYEPLLRGEPGAGGDLVAELVELVGDVEQGEHHALLDRPRQPGSPLHLLTSLTIPIPDTQP